MSRTMRPSTWLRNASRTTSPMASKSASHSGRTTTSLAGTALTGTSLIPVSRVVEEGVVETHERSRPLGVGALDRLRAEMVDDVGRADALREVAAAVVHLQEVSPRAAARRQPAVPRVRDEERHVAGRAVEDR